MTYADVLRPTIKRQAMLYDISLIAGGSIFLALLAQLAIPLPFTGVPITGQTFGVLLIGALLGSRRGPLTILAYLSEGVAGLPVFAGGLAGPAVFAGPTGGYLLGFAFAAFLTGLLAEHGWDRKVGSTFIMMLIGTTVIFLCGALWLGFLVPWHQVITLGVLPFLPGALIKISLATLLLPSGWKMIQRFQE